jgi:sigma-54 dependent transcriptional regulator, acetoin dehydrogenase operon transcriptional activator AcoR
MIDYYNVSKYNYNDDIPANCELFQCLLPLMNCVAPTNMPVLIIGEVGTKKSLIAKVIHNNSRRKNGRLVVVNCKNPNLNDLEIELFGHEKNKTNYGKVQVIGKLEQANGGSILLDEIGSTPNIIQARLLKVIQDQEIYRVGGTNVVPIDVRIIATTSEELEYAIRAGSFREDLFYRIAVFPIFIHPLRTSRNDIKILAYHFLNATKNKANKTVISISDDAMKLMMDYDFPGNISELEKVIEYATNIEKSDKLQSESLPEYIRSGQKINPIFQPYDLEDKIITLEEIEKQALIHAMKITGNNIQVMAKALGVNRATVYRKLEKYNLLIKQ